MKLFIDTNTYLAFIRTSEEKLNSITEIEKLIKESKLSLIFPQITQDEFLRNISNVSATYIKELEAHLPKPPKVAVSLHNKKLSKKIKDLHKEYKKEVRGLITEYLKSVQKIKVKVLALSKNQAEKKYNEEGLLQIAQQRRLRGNPPGKNNGPLGDELEWEILLNNFFDDDLTIITNDKDWLDSLDNNKLNPFLVNEWGTKSSKNISLYNTLGEFINDFTKEEKVSEAEIQEEKETTSLIEFTTHPTPLNWGLVNPNQGNVLSVGSQIIPTSFVASQSSLDSRYVSLNDPTITRHVSNLGSLNAGIGSICPKCNEPLFNIGTPHICKEQ